MCVCVCACVCIACVYGCLSVMTSPFTKLELLTIVFSLLVFGLCTLTGMIREECSHTQGKIVQIKHTHREDTYPWTYIWSKCIKYIYEPVFLYYANNKSYNTHYFLCPRNYILKESGHCLTLGQEAVTQICTSPRKSFSDVYNCTASSNQRQAYVLNTAWIHRYGIAYN